MSLIPNSRRGSSSVFDPFSLNLWDPFKDFPFPSSSSLSAFPEFSRENSAFVNTRVDWKETPEAHVFKADVPGLKKEEVKVEVEDDRVLKISGERSVEKEDKNDKWHRVERSSGKFLRRFQLPEDAKVDQIKAPFGIEPLILTAQPLILTAVFFKAQQYQTSSKAAMENGVLSVTVPKTELKNVDVRAIEISG